MSRKIKNVLPIEDWPDLKKGKLYRGIVKQDAPDKKRRCIFVTIENLDPTQLGCIHNLTMPLPIRPGNAATLFLTACGLDASSAGNKVCVDDLVGVAIGISFERAAGAEDHAPVRFEHIPKPDFGGTENGTSGTQKPQQGP